MNRYHLKNGICSIGAYNNANQTDVNIANQLHTIPTTQASLNSSSYKYDKHLQPFIDIVKNPKSGWKPASPTGRLDEDTMNGILSKAQTGQDGNLQKALQDAAGQIDTASKL